MTERQLKRLINEEIENILNEGIAYDDATAIKELNRLVNTFDDLNSKIVDTCGAIRRQLKYISTNTTNDGLFNLVEKSPLGDDDAYEQYLRNVSGMIDKVNRLDLKPKPKPAPTGIKIMPELKLYEDYILYYLIPTLKGSVNRYEILMGGGDISDSPKVPRIYSEQAKSFDELVRGYYTRTSSGYDGIVALPLSEYDAPIQKISTWLFKQCGWSIHPLKAGYVRIHLLKTDPSKIKDTQTVTQWMV